MGTELTSRFFVIDRADSFSGASVNGCKASVKLGKSASAPGRPSPPLPNAKPSRRIDLGLHWQIAAF
jgi:hypothetical protein